MQKDSTIPVLNKLIEKGAEISMSDLGLDDNLHIGIDGPVLGDLVIGDPMIDDLTIDDTLADITLPNTGPVDSFIANSELEQSVRRIFDEHMELAWEEIRLEIQRAFEKSRD
jgi:hypothetical protein